MSASTSIVTASVRARGVPARVSRGALRASSDRATPDVSGSSKGPAFIKSATSSGVTMMSFSACRRRAVVVVSVASFSR